MIGKIKAFGAGFLLGIFVAPRSGAEVLETLPRAADSALQTRLLGLSLDSHQ